MKIASSLYSKTTVLALLLLCLFKSATTNAQWSEVGGANSSTFNKYINSIITDVNDNLYAVGNFTNANGKKYVAKWNGIAWSELGGTNTSTFDSSIFSVTTDPIGNVYVAGSFTNANGKKYVAKWDGTSWSELGGSNTSTFNDTIWTITIDNFGNLYASGNFKNHKGYEYVAKWNGSTWEELGGSNTSTFNNHINIITPDSQGNVYVGGWFKNDSNFEFVAKWNGATWVELGGKNTSKFNNAIVGISPDSKGNLYIGGFFTNGNGYEYTAKWNGTAWSELGGTNSSTFNNGIECTAIDGNDNLYIGGWFTNSNGKEYVAKWNGTLWSELGATTSNFNSAIWFLATDSKNNVYGAGYFLNAKGHHYVAKFGPLGVPTPSILSFTPNSTCPGTSIPVFITGANLTGTSSVTVGGVAVDSFKVNNSSSITAYISNGTTGKIAVTSPNGTAISDSVFTFGLGHTAYAYIANGIDKTVSVINTITKNVVTTIPVGNQPSSISASPDGKSVYVTNSQSDSISVINTANNKVVASIPIPTQPTRTCFSPDGTRFYQLNYSHFSSPQSSLTVINTANYAVLQTLKLGVGAYGLAISPDGSTLYVTNSDSNFVAFISTTNFSVIAKVAVGQSADYVAVSPDGLALYVENFSDSSITVINTVSHQATATIKLNTIPVAAVVSLDGTKLYVVNTFDNTISVISTISYTTVATITVGVSPQGISISPDGKELYVPNSQDNTVSVINTATNKVTSSIFVGNNPIAMGNFIANVPTPCAPPPCNLNFNPLPDTIKYCGSSVVLDAGSGFASYNWSNGKTSEGTTINQSGKYFITVTNNASCSATDSVFISLINATIFNKASLAIGADTTIKYDSSLALSVDKSKGFYMYDTLDFSNQFNINLATTYGIASYKNIPTGNDTFAGIPFYIYPWTNTKNGWDAYAGVKNGNPNILSLNTHGYNTSALHLLANTEWGKANFTSVRVQFWSAGQIIYEKPLYGNVDLRDWNKNPNTTDTINNTTTVGIWNDGARRLDKLRIELPTATNVDSILVVDSGWYNYNNYRIQQYIFVMAATLEASHEKVSWSTGQTVPSIQVTPLQTTTYTVSVTDGINTCTDSVKVIVIPPVEITSFNSPVCPNSSDTIRGSKFTGATLVTFGNDTATSFKVIDDSTIIAIVGKGASGSVKVYTPNGTASLAGFVYLLPTSSTTDTSICRGNSFIFNGKTYDSAGTYTTHLANSVGCDSTATLVLTIKAADTSYTKGSYCKTPYVFNGKSYDSVGIYTINLSTSKGCDSVAVLVLSQDSTQILYGISGANQVCLNQTDTLKDITLGGSWKSLDTTILNVDSIGTLNGVSVGIVKGLNIGTTSITYTLSNSCGSQTTPPQTIQVIGIKPTIDTIINNATCFSPQSGKIALSITGTEGPYQDSVNGNWYTVYDTIANLGVGNYTFYIKNSEGCMVDTLQNVPVSLIDDASCYTLYVPSGFVPTTTNPTGATKLLKPFGGSPALKAITFKVFNRFGGLVFESHDLVSGWDGTVNGTLQDTGTYVWMLEYTINNTRKFDRGTSTLIR